MLLGCEVIHRGKGEDMLVWIIWCVGKNGENCWEGFFMVLPWEPLYMAFERQDPWENGFYSDTHCQ